MKSAEQEKLLAELDTPENRARLHEIEVNILDALKERPDRHFCKGCVRMLRMLHAKATGKDWRRL